MKRSEGRIILVTCVEASFGVHSLAARVALRTFSCGGHLFFSGLSFGAEVDLHGGDLLLRRTD